MHKSITCCSGVALALHRVFIAPVEAYSLRPRNSLLQRLTSNKPAIRNAPLYSNLQFRRSVVTAASAAQREERLPRDEEITSWSISLVHPDNSITSENTYETISNLDLTKFSLVQVQPSQPGKLPVCKIIDKKKLYEQKKAKSKVVKSAPSKTIELNWAIEQGDLAHRLDKIQDFLAKGMKLEVVISPKRRGKLATQDQAEDVLKRVRATASEVPGVREVKGKPGVLGKEYILLFEGTAPKNDEPAKDGKDKKGKKNRISGNATHVAT